MSEQKAVSIPLEDPFEIPEGIVIDLKSAQFADDFDDNIATAFVYLRNIEFSGKIDFSGFSEDEKLKILKLYMTRDIKDFSIAQLDYTVLSLYLDINKDGVEPVLSNEERQKFKEQYADVFNELLQLFVSLPLFIISLDKNILDCDFSEVPHVETFPMTYECMSTLLKYDEANLLMLLPVVEDLPLPEKVFFDKVFKYDNSQLADAVQNTVFRALYDGMINVAANNSEFLQKEQ